MNANPWRRFGRRFSPLALCALVLLAACDRGGTGSANPIPQITSLSVPAVERGTAATITIWGSRFIETSTVRVDGFSRPTEYVSGSELRATLAESDVAASGSIQITVSNPGPGGGVSNAIPLDVVTPIVAIGDTVSEVLVTTSQAVREYRIPGNAGDEWIAFVQTDRPIVFVLVDSSTNQPISRQSVQWGMPALEEWSTGRVVLPRTGTYLVHVIVHGGASYRFRIDAVDRAPETGSASIKLGMVVAEAIGTVGDIDEYTFTGSAGQEMNLLVQLTSGMSEGLRVELMHGGNVLERVDLSTPTASLDEAGSGRFSLPANAEYVVRVSGPVRGSVAAATGAYRFELYPVDRRPEAGGDVRLDGAPVAGSIERPGDVDEFQVQGSAGDQVVIHFTGMQMSGGSLLAELRDQIDEVVAAAVSDGLTFTAGLNYSWRATLPRTGPYTLRVSGSWPRSMAKGSYTVELYTVSDAPEHVPSAIEIGERVTGERIDRPGDPDVFTFRGTPGREVNVFFGVPQDSAKLIAYVQKVGDTGPPVMMAVAGNLDLDSGSTGRIRLEDATYRIRVDPHFSAQATETGIQGSYALRVFPIDRAPEGRSAAYVLGDTVRGEPLYPAGDVDEYTFTVDEETSLRIYWAVGQEPGPETSVSGILRREGESLGLWGSQSTFNGQPVRRITLAPGSYRLTVLNPNMNAPASVWMPRIATLLYSFAFIRE
jgi:hypothetical protein